VGAYLRPLDDARRANIQFTTECLAFANVPDERMLDEWLPDATPPQHPRWKSRTPRDSGVGWDFDDVRDHYLRALFGIDPAALRYADVPRYLALSRVVTGEAMASTLAEWRRAGSRCSGALIWFLRDLWPSAGWGVLDARGEPKPAYYFVRRVLAPRSVILIDEGLNGLDAHVINESPSGLAAELRVALYRGEARTVAATVTVDVPPFGVACTRLAAMFEHFVDSTYAYRFGPPAHDVAVATLVQRDGVTLGESFHFPRGLPSDQDAEIGLEATARPEADGWILELRTRRFAQAIAIDVVGYASDDNYFHLAPGSARALNLRRTDERAQRPQGSVRPLNSLAPTKIIVAASSA
jgi:beta-mannosidase